jgi:hypothetical protein
LNASCWPGGSLRRRPKPRCGLPLRRGLYKPARRHSGISYLSPIAYETQMIKETRTT